MRNLLQGSEMKTTKYFASIRRKPDRALIQVIWIERTIAWPEHREVQQDGRIRLWEKVGELNNRYIRVKLLSDGETVYNAFLDRRYKS